PRVSNVGLELEAGAVQHIIRQTLKEFADNSIRPFAKTLQQVNEEIKADPKFQRRLMGETRQDFQDLGVQLDMARMKGYRVWNQDSALGTGFSTARQTTEQLNEAMLSKGELLFVPEWIAKSVSSLVNGYGWEHSAFGKFTMQSTNVMKASVMTLSPKHLAHIVFGGLFF